MDSREHYCRHVEERLRRLDARIADLRRQVERAGGSPPGGPQQLQHRLHDLEQRRATVEQRLAELRAAPGEEWERHRGALDGLTKDVEEAVQGAFLHLG